MREIVFDNSFKKSFKKVRSYRNFKKDKYETLLDILISGGSIPREYDDHGTAKHSPKWLQGKRILHLAPNICIIYCVDDNTIYLNDIGSHQDLELTEDI